MPVTEAVAYESQMDLGIHKSNTHDLQDVLSRQLPRFYRSAYRQLGNAADAEDAVQDALLAAYKHLDQFRGQAQLSTWLTAIVTNCARMQMRKRPRQPHMSLDEQLGPDQEYSLADRLPSPGPSPEDECSKAELHGHLVEYVAQLSTPLRRAYQLSDVEGRSVKEIAQTLGLAEGTVKAQLSRARAKLSRMMRRFTASSRRPRQLREV